MKYRVQSGDMDFIINTPHRADARYLAHRALDLHQDIIEKGDCLGVIIEVSGGQYRGDDVTYFNTENMLRLMGLLK